jgi:hypothetical protein
VTRDEVWIGNWIWLLQTINTFNYSTSTNSHTAQCATTHTKSSQSAVSSPVVDW